MALSQQQQHIIEFAKTFLIANLTDAIGETKLEFTEQDVQDAFARANVTVNDNVDKPEIQRILNPGELHFETYEEMIESAGRALDKAYSYNICGPVYFEGTDGKFYGLFVEALVTEVDRIDALTDAYESGSDTLTDAEIAEAEAAMN